MKAKFALGTVVMTPGVREDFAGLVRLAIWYVAVLWVTRDRKKGPRRA